MGFDESIGPSYNSLSIMHSSAPPEITEIRFRCMTKKKFGNNVDG